MIYESDALEIRRTEIETGNTCRCQDFGDFSAIHFVINGNPGFRSGNQSADLVSGDSIVFSEETPYEITNGAPSRSVILSVLFKTLTKDVRA